MLPADCNSTDPPPPPPLWGGRGVSGWVGGWVSLGGWVGCLVLRQPHRDPPPPPPPLVSKGLVAVRPLTGVPQSCGHTWHQAKGGRPVPKDTPPPPRKVLVPAFLPCEILEKTACVTGGEEFFPRIQQGVLFHPMCVRSKCSEYIGDFRSSSEIA